MAFIPTVESAQRAINQSRVIYQDALAQVAVGREQLQQAVDSGRVQPGSPEFLQLRNELVNRPQAFADTVKLQYDDDLANLDRARDFAAGNAGVLDTGDNNFVSPRVNPQVNDNIPPIIGVGQIDPAAEPLDLTQIPIIATNPVTGEIVQDAEPLDLSQIPIVARGDFVTTGTGLNVLAEDVDFGAEPAPEGLLRLNDGANLGVPDEFGFTTTSTGLNVLPEDQQPGEPEGYITEFTPTGSRLLSSAEVDEASRTAALRDQARQQQTIREQRKQVNAADWRVRLRLAPQAKYLYKAPSPGILAPLTITDGVIFPYTPSINTSYKANYSSYDLTHSNYRGYFYQGSYVDAINISAMFTAQDTSEANYLLAVIHFFRSVTKMFYGNDAERGSPPPLTYLSGLGEYQFNEHPCLIQSFNYNLPADVDYIRAGSVTNSGTNLTTNRDRQSVATQGVFGSLNRLAAAFLTKGAIPGIPAPGLLQINNPTYVPTKMEIQLTLLPIQSRQQVSQQFSVKNFANGNLLKGGFW